MMDTAECIQCSMLTFHVMVAVHTRYLQRYLDGRSMHVRSSITLHEMKSLEFSSQSLSQSLIG